MAEKNQRDPFETKSIFQASQKFRSYFGYLKVLSSDDKNFHFKEQITHFEHFSVFRVEMGEFEPIGRIKKYKKSLLRNVFNEPLER